MSIETNAPEVKPNTEPIEVTRDADQWTNIQVDSTMLSVFMSCPAKYNYVMNRHLVPIDGVSKSIRRGSIVHDGVLIYWREMIASGDFKIAVERAVETIRNGVNKEIDFDNDFKLETLQGIIEFFKHMQSLSWIPLEAEKFFRIKAYEDESIKLRIYLTGRIDLILRTPQIPILPVDAKTETERWFHSQMSNQFRIYCIATKTNLLGVQRIGFQKTLEAKDKFKMEMLPFDQDVLDEWKETTLVYWTQQMLLAHHENVFPMNPTNCIHGHFKCQFSDGNDHKGICNVSRSVREQKIGRYFVVGPEWNPETVGSV